MGNSVPSFDLGTYSNEFSESEACEDGTNELSWRNDASECFSDWRIIITISNGTEDENIEQQSKRRRLFQTDDDSCSPGENVYHVHKYILACGPRRSEYFSRLFHTKIATQESQHRTSRIPMNAASAAAFPVMLDFVYGTAGPDKVSRTNAVALRHLANYFGIRDLYYTVNDFLQKDLTTDSAVGYALDAAAYQDVKLSDSAVKICTENFESIPDEHLLKLPCDIFEQIVMSPNLSCSVERLSLKIATYLEACPGVTGETLRKLTSRVKMPAVAFEKVLFFLKVAADLKIGGNMSSADCLQNRCTAACSRKWTVAFDNNEGFELLSTEVKISLLRSALHSARAHVKTMQSLQSS